MTDTPIKPSTHKRRRNKYEKVDNQKRRMLIELVHQRDMPIKHSAIILGMNYSTAKTIL